MSLRSLFTLAAQHAIAYRDAVDEAAPPRGYAAMREVFDALTPEQGKAESEVIEELVALSTPGLRAMTGPRFFGWVIGASHPAGVAADWLTSAWGQNAGNHEASPAAAAVEAVAAHWLLDLLDLPREASVGFVTGATVANFVCLAAARGAVLRRAGWDVEANGLFGAPPIQVLIGDDAHTSVFSALQFLGLGHDRVVRVATDVQGRMLPAAFTRAMAGANGPAIVIIQAGQLNTGAFDPIEAILPEVRARGAWVHVDGAFGLWARACPATALLASGYELAELLGDRRTQVAADTIRLRLCHRARCGGASPGDDHRGQLPAPGRGRRPRSHPFCPGAVTSCAWVRDLGDDPPSRPRGYRRIGAGTLPARRAVR